MIERNEMRIQYFIAKLEKTIREEHQIRKEVQQLELRNKLASIYANDKEGYERALRFSGVFKEDTTKENNQVKEVFHTAPRFQSKL